MEPDLPDLYRRDLEAHSKSITELINNEIRRKDQEEAQKQLDALKEEHLEERLGRIEASVRSIFGLYKWIGVSAGSALLLAVVTFIIKGGLLA